MAQARSTSLTTINRPHHALKHRGGAYELAAGRLVKVLPDWPQPSIDAFFLYYASRQQLRAPLKVFGDFLRANYRRVLKQ